MIRLIECFSVGMIVFAFVGGCVDAGDCTCLKTKKHRARSKKRIQFFRKSFLLPAKKERPIEDPVKHVWWSVVAKIINSFQQLTFHKKNLEMFLTGS